MKAQLAFLSGVYPLDDELALDRLSLRARDATTRARFTLVVGVGAYVRVPVRILPRGDQVLLPRSLRPPVLNLLPRCRVQYKVKGRVEHFLQQQVRTDRQVLPAAVQQQQQMSNADHVHWRHVHRCFAGRVARAPLRDHAGLATHRQQRLQVAFEFVHHTIADLGLYVLRGGHQ